MNLSVLILVLLGLTAYGYYSGRRRAFAAVGGGARRLHSLPSYHGAYLGLWVGIPSFLLIASWLLVEPIVAEEMVVAALPPETANLPPERLGLFLNQVRNIVAGEIIETEITPAMQAAAAHYAALRETGSIVLVGVSLAVALGCLGFARRRLAPQFRARNQVELIVRWVLIACSTIAVLTTIGIVLSLLFESIRFFRLIPLGDFLFGLSWSPQTAIRADQVGSSGAFGVVPLLLGTAVVTVVAMLVAVPVGLFSAIYMVEYASPRVRSVTKPLIEILAGIPTVVYGAFAALTVAPLLRNWGAAIGLDVASESALAAGLVMGIMIIPFMSSLSDDVMNAVPQSLRDGSYALGATQSETIRQVVIPAALPGIMGSFLLAVSRAIGETMIVVMAAGLAANLTVNPLQAVTTVTVQIVTLLVGDQEFDSAKTLAAFALGLFLFVVTLCLNVVALMIVRRYRERYD